MRFFIRDVDKLTFFFDNKVKKLKGFCFQNLKNQTNSIPVKIAEPPVVSAKTCSTDRLVNYLPRLSFDGRPVEQNDAGERARPPSSGTHFRRLKLEPNFGAANSNPGCYQFYAAEGMSVGRRRLRSRLASVSTAKKKFCSIQLRISAMERNIIFLF